MSPVDNVLVDVQHMLVYIRDLLGGITFIIMYKFDTSGKYHEGTKFYAKILVPLATYSRTGKSLSNYYICTLNLKNILPYLQNALFFFFFFFFFGFSQLFSLLVEGSN